MSLSLSLSLSVSRTRTFVSLATGFGVFVSRGGSSLLMRLLTRRSGGVGVDLMPGDSGRNLSGSGVRCRTMLVLDAVRRNVRSPGCDVIDGDGDASWPRWSCVWLSEKLRGSESRPPLLPDMAPAAPAAKAAAAAAPGPEMPRDGVEPSSPSSEP